MFKFRCFRASFDFITGKQHGWDCDLSPVSVIGVYRKNDGDHNDEELMYNPPRKLLPSMVQLPMSQTGPITTSKSTCDLTKETIPTQNLTRSLHDVSLSKHQLKEQKKLEKQQMLEQKKQTKTALQERQRQEKFAAQERKKQEKLAIKQKLAAQDRQKLEKAAEEAKTQGNLAREQDQPKSPINKLKLKKKTAPIPPQPINQQIPQKNNPEEQTSKNEVTEPKPRRPAQTTARNNQSNYSTYTLESSISRSSGPPPYGEYPEIITDVPDSNVTFGKPVADSSWDLISQHREQMSKNRTEDIVPKTKKDVQYNVGNLLGENSDA
ncbi:triadin-like [Pieris brassicae]|uniref:triadin-like n=1 Tax=Pieris brassicae TaxID=7116 RepID=UPI001E660D08|nr:triadin-like [Pieris brassicae]